MGDRRNRRKARSLAERNVPPTNWYPGMYGPGQTHRDGPLSNRARLTWNIVIYGLGAALIVLFLVMLALSD